MRPWAHTGANQWGSRSGEMRNRVLTQTHSTSLQSTHELQGSSPVENSGRHHLNQLSVMNNMRTGTKRNREPPTDTVRTQHHFRDTAAKHTQPESTRRKQQTQMEGHPTKSLHYNLLKYRGHETQRQSKENQPRRQEGRRPCRYKCSKARPSVIKATTGTAGKMGMGSKDGLGVSLFWWLYCGYIKNVFVCGKYIVKNLGVMASGWQLTLKKKFFVLETSIRLWLFQNRNYTKNLSSIVNAHH